MPFLTHALDPLLAQKLLGECCHSWADGPRTIELLSIRVLRHKPGRRCLIEYELSAPELLAKSVTVLGKVRAKGLDKKCFDLMKTLWQGKFGPQSEDAIRIPQPIGVIQPFQMWLQAKAP